MTPAEIHVVNHRLDPHETELRIRVRPNEITARTEIKGRLMGPRNLYASTIEVAYPLHEVARGDSIDMRVVIPEASWWEPKAPFRYEGPIEVWQDDKLSERTRVSHVIFDLRLGPNGLRLNGRKLTLRGRQVHPGITEREMQALHQQGINAVMTSFETEQDWYTNIGIWSQAARCGLWVLCQALADFDLATFATVSEIGTAFGCVIANSTADAEVRHARSTMNRSCWLGICSDRPSLPEGAAFVLCKEDAIAANPVKLPRIVTTDRLPDPLPDLPGIIGWVQT